MISAISAGSPTTTSATITWTTNESATSKVVYGTTTGYGSATSSASLVTSHSIGVIGLTASTTYHYAVVSTDGVGNTATSSDQTFTTGSVPDTTPPSTPTNLVATATSSSEIDLSWTASTDNVGVTGYQVFRGGSQIATSTQTTYADTGLAASTQYTYTVSAYDAAGNNSAQSSSASATTYASVGATIFNCSGFATSGGTTTPCEATVGSGSSPYFIITGTTGGSSPGISGSAVNLMPAACQHCALSLNYQPLVNIQAFQTTFTFVSNGWNVSFVANNSNNNPGFNGNNFSAGAGCECGFFQGFAQAVAPNNVFALMLDSYSGLVAGSSSFTYSGAQYYQGAFASNAPNPPGQSPCNPNLGGTDFTYAGVNKVSTFPVPLNTPANATFQNYTGSQVGTGDTYSVTITYDGNNLSISRAALEKMHEEHAKGE